MGWKRVYQTRILLARRQPQHSSSQMNAKNATNIRHNAKQHATDKALLLVIIKLC